VKVRKVRLPDRYIIIDDSCSGEFDWGVYYQGKGWTHDLTKAYLFSKHTVDKRLKQAKEFWGGSPRKLKVTLEVEK
jgi:hypothetical protein